MHEVLSACWFNVFRYLCTVSYTLNKTKKRVIVNKTGDRMHHMNIKDVCKVEAIDD